MEKVIFELMLEEHFEDFELGDAIQVFDDYIYFEFLINGEDRKMRIPFHFDSFQKEVEWYGDFYVAAKMSMIKTEILKRLLDLKEGE